MVEDTEHCVQRKVVVSAVLKLDVLVPDRLLFILAVACAEGWYNNNNNNNNNNYYYYY